MKILILSGSKDHKGQTALMCNAIIKGVTKAEGTAELIFLPELKLERCRQCDSKGMALCGKEGRCIIKDDFASLIDKVKTADVIVFATPVFFMEPSESIWTFIGRYRRTVFRAGMTPSAGGTPAVILCNAGGSGNGGISCASIMECGLQICGFDIVDTILVRRQNTKIKLPMLELTGKWLVTRPTSGPPFTPHPLRPRK